MRRTVITCGLSLSSLLAFAQEIKKTEPEKPGKENAYGKVSLGFENNSLFYGRKDSAATPYITPGIGYHDKSGFYINGSVSYLPKSGDNRIDATTVGAGYDFSIGNFGGELAADKFFNNNNSTNVRAEVKGDASAMFSYDFGFIETTVQPGINFSNKTDYWLACGLDHYFSLAEEKISINPSLLLNGTTRNFYGAYYQKRRFKRKNGAQASVSASITDPGKFKLMDYEFSLPLGYTLKKFSFSITPVYTVPVNPAQLTVTVKPVSGPGVTKVFDEKLENTFTVQLEAAFKF